MLPFFKPNTVFLSVSGDGKFYENYKNIIKIAKQNSYGVLLYVPFENVGLSLEKDITLWLKDFSPAWKTNFDISNNDLSVLIALLLQKNWNGNINVRVARDKQTNSSEKDITTLKDLVRFPIRSKIEHYELEDELELLTTNRTDLNILPLSYDLSIEDMIKVTEFSRTSAIFCMDSF